MRRFTILAAGVFVAFGLLSTRAHAQGAIEKGKAVYAENKCQRCHSINGEGAKKGALDGVGTKLTPAELREWIVNAPEMTKKTNATRKPAMKAYKLSKDDLEALVAYMSSLKKK